MIFGTDLAIERREITNSGKNDGVTVKKRRVKSASVTEIEITTDVGAEKLGKPVGTYVTVELPPFSSEFDDADSRMFAVRDEIKKLLPKNTSGVLVVGLGNSDITPDALGPKTAKDIFSTRHITKSLAEEVGLPSLRPVSSASPGVLGQTGIESAEMIRGIMTETSPDAVITVDALSARSIKRLGCTVQMTNTGIVPGSGVGNHRAEISRKTLGVPVIAIGVPTVVDAAALVYDITGNENIPQPERERAEKMMVTPREIDVMISRASRLLALAINSALQPDMDMQTLLSLV